VKPLFHLQKERASGKVSKPHRSVLDPRSLRGTHLLSLIHLELYDTKELGGGWSLVFFRGGWVCVWGGGGGVVGMTSIS